MTVFLKLEGVLVLFNKTSREVNIIFPFFYKVLIDVFFFFWQKMLLINYLQSHTIGFFLRENNSFYWYGHSYLQQKHHIHETFTKASKPLNFALDWIHERIMIKRGSRNKYTCVCRDTLVREVVATWSITLLILIWGRFVRCYSFGYHLTLLYKG